MRQGEYLARELRPPLFHMFNVGPPDFLWGGGGDPSRDTLYASLCCSPPPGAALCQGVFAKRSEKMEKEHCLLLSEVMRVVDWINTFSFASLRIVRVFPRSLGIISTSIKVHLFHLLGVCDVGGDQRFIF